MSESGILEKFFERAPSKEIRLVAARGLMPLPAAEMLHLLVRLARDPEAEVAQQATETLAGWDGQELVTHLKSEECSPEVFDFYSGTADSRLQEAIILNPRATGPVIAKLAGCVEPSHLETILYNRTRLLASPEILSGIKSNPAATPQILRQVEEIETEFFGSKKREYEVSETVEETDSGGETLEFLAETPTGDLTLEGLPLDPQAREAALSGRIGSMTVRQKIQLALKGTREIRAVLVRDANKEVARSVLQSPKLSMPEIEAFSAMRNTSDEVLRLIGISKAWVRNYTVVQNLVKNPKTPPLISQRLLARLLQKDLVALTRDRGIPEAVRRNADRMLKQRAAARPSG